MASAVMQVDPITKARPGPADFAKGINQLHTCLESHKKSTLQEFKGVRRDLKIAAKNAATAAAAVQDIKLSMGIAEGQKPVAGLSTPWVAFRRTVLATTASITAIFVAYKTLLVISPALLVLWHSFDMAARKALL